MRARGYSLVELIVTLVVMGILAAMAIPYFSKSDPDATWFHEQVKAAVRYAQRQAVAQRRPVFVVIATNSVQLCYDALCTSRVQDFASGANYTLNAPSGTVLSPAPKTISFNGLGQPTPIAGDAFSVGGKGVTVTAETGYVP
jgi:MSHA pilin protein MshC